MVGKLVDPIVSWVLLALYMVGAMFSWLLLALWWICVCFYMVLPF